MAKKKSELEKAYGKFWKEFSFYIRNTELNCFSCGKRTDPKESNAGHYIHEGNRHIWLLKSSELNIHTQCVHCNKWLRGNPTAYAVHLEQKYGFGILQQLHELKWKPYIPTVEEVLQKAEYYRKKNEKLR